MYGTRIDKRPRRKLSLTKISTKPPAGLDRERAEAQFAGIGDELFELQQLMYGAGTHSLLVVLQGRDAAGKDGTIKHVVGCLNPRGVNAPSFGVPSEVEREHDYLWRVHQHAPRRGHVAIFNRSHYEDVLVVRVDKLAPPSVWRARYEQINQFEALLASANTIIVKLFLHISADEQAQRFVERELDASKAFKLNVKDWQKRRQWAEYTRAYEDALTRCASVAAPWVVVPSDKKWFRNLVVARALRDALAPHRRSWRRALDAMGKEQVAALDVYRATPHGAAVAAAVDKAARRGEASEAGRSAESANEPGQTQDRTSDNNAGKDRTSGKKAGKDRDDKKKNRNKKDKKKNKKDKSGKHKSDKNKSDKRHKGDGNKRDGDKRDGNKRDGNKRDADKDKGAETTSTPEKADG